MLVWLALHIRVMILVSMSQTQTSSLGMVSTSLEGSRDKKGPIIANILAFSQRNPGGHVRTAVEDKMTKNKRQTDKR